MYIQTKRRQKKVHLGRDAVATVLDDEENKWWKGMVSFFLNLKKIYMQGADHVVVEQNLFHIFKL